MTHKTTLPDNQWLTYGCAPAITWLRDADQILLIDAEREQFWSLRGVEAAIWDLMILAYPYEKTVHLLSLLLRNSTDEAEKVFLTTLDSWHYAGIIQVVEENKRGESSN
jgi:hypothetical protein